MNMATQALEIEFEDADPLDYFGHPVLGDVIKWVSENPRCTLFDLWSSWVVKDGLSGYVAGFAPEDGRWKVVRYPEAYFLYAGLEKMPEYLSDIFTRDSYPIVARYFDEVLRTGAMNLSKRTMLRPSISGHKLTHWRLLFPIYQDNKICAVVTVIPPVDLYILRILESEKMDMPATVGVESDVAFRVCRTILKYSLREEKLNAFLLSDEIGVNRRTIYRLVNMLSEAGLVYEFADPDDKRRTIYFLTQLGENKVMSNLDRHSGKSS